MPKQLKQRNIREERERILIEQDYICPLCNEIIEPCDAALDHDHENGLIRGVLHKVCNSGEGQMRGKFRRSGIAKYSSFEEYLLNLSLYLTKEQHMMLHPSHAPKPRKLQKRSYQELLKALEQYNHYAKENKNRKIKIPDFPKSGKLTKRLKELYEQFKIYPKYYSK